MVGQDLTAPFLCALLHVKIMEIVQVQGYASVLMVGQDMTAPFMSVILTV
jgi:hypothetical protein